MIAAMLAHPPHFTQFHSAACAMVATAEQNGLVPVAWCFGPDLRQKASEYLDQHGVSSQHYLDHYGLPVDQIGVHGEFMGLPVCHMIADGLALRTVRKQSPLTGETFEHFDQ